MPVAVANIRTNTGRQRARVGLLRQMTVFERSFAVTLSRIFNWQWKRAAQQVRLGSKNPHIGNKGELLIEYRKHYMRVLKVFGQIGFNSAGKKELSPEEIYWREVRHLTNSKDLANKVVDVNKVTKKRIRTVIKHGMTSGWTNAQIAERINNVAGLQNRRRAETIARTETLGVATKAVHESLKAASPKVKWKKIWTSALDTRTRPDHAKANSQRKDMDKPFIVGGAKLMLPGDPNGPPEQIINCRCVALYEQK